MYMTTRKSQDMHEYQDNIRNAVNDAAMLLLSSSSETFNQALFDAMKCTGNAVDVDRMYIWENHEIDGQLCCTQIFEWSEGAEPQQGNELTVAIPWSEVAPNWYRHFQNDESVNGFVRHQAKEEREHLEAQGILSVLVLPIYINKEFWGFVGFDDCRNERLFFQEEETILRSVGLLFANAWIRNQMMLNLQETSAQLEIALEQASSASKSKSDFLASMSHEIRTPLNAILGTVQIQLQRSDLQSYIREAFSTIYSSGSDLLAIINDILDLSKIETGKLELHTEEYDLVTLLEDVAILNAIFIGSKRIELIVDADTDLPSKLRGDKTRVKQVINNLLSNAIKYTEKGRVELNIRHIETGGDIQLHIDISDTGRGIKKENIADLFSEYSRFGDKSIAEGTGLGLPITLKLVKLMGGTIEVESIPDKGSLFKTTITQGKVDCEPIGSKDADKIRDFTFEKRRHGSETKIEREPMPYGKVLVVDDVYTNLMVAEGLLSVYELEVHLVESGFAAIDRVKSGEYFDIIFMDHMMPEMDGLETTIKLRQMGYEGTIVALTANVLKETRELFLRSGFDAFLGKPMDLRMLNTVLNDFVRDKHPTEAAKYRKSDNVIAEDNQDDEPSEIILSIFRNDAKDALLTFRETAVTGSFRRENDLKNFTTAAHSMRSALAYIGHHELSQDAAELEIAARNNDRAFISEKAPIFVDNLEKLISQS